MSEAKVVVFRGPAHHGQLLRPVEDALERRGAEVVRYTADTEANFQIGLQEEFEGVPGKWVWLNDFLDEGEARQLYRTHKGYFRKILGEPNAASLLVPQVLDRLVLFVCREWVALRALLRKEKPTHAMALHPLNRWGMMLMSQAMKRGIPSFVFQEGLYYGHPWIYTRHTAFGTTALVWGEATRRKLLESGCAASQIEVFGHPDIEQRLGRGEREAAVLQQELPEQARGKRLCFVFVTSAHMEETQEKQFFAGMEGSEWFCVVRSHRLAPLPDLKSHRDVFARCPSNCWVSEGSLAHHWRLMAAAEVGIVVGCSSVILEWACTGKPLGQIRVEGGRQHRDFAEEGIAVDCEGLPLRQAIEKTVREWPEHEGAAERFVGDELASGDGAERMAVRILG